ncbi:MAG TPA: helix-turn-helix domain-containing protein [Hyphomicrobiales bacterium]|nr:helix-turn-helix domain-containing protein [Hyphomicrobiales bacterium]
MDLAGFSQKDLAGLLGSRSRASEILNRKRALNLVQVQRIAAAWKIPAELLIQAYPVGDAA